MVFGAPLTLSEARFSNMVYLCQEMGWTLDYVESLDMRTFNRVLTVIEARNKAKAHLERRGQGQNDEG